MSVRLSCFGYLNLKTHVKLLEKDGGTTCSYHFDLTLHYLTILKYSNSPFE